MRNHHAPPPIRTNNAASAAKSGMSAERFWREPLSGQCGLRLRGNADSKRVDPNRVSDILQLDLAEIADCEIEPAFDLAIGVLGKADRARLANALQPRGDVDAVTHEVAVALFDDVAQMNAEAKEDAPVLRHFDIALDHRALHFDRAADGVDHAAELDDAAVAGALDDAAMMHGDERVDQVAAKGPKAGQGRSRPRRRVGDSQPHPRLGSPQFFGFRTWRALTRHAE